MSAQGATPTADRITAKLQKALAPVALEVIDESHKHAGHAHVMHRAGTAQNPRARYIPA